MNNVSFKTGLKSEWQTLKDEGRLDVNTLYFCVDSHEIFKGALLFGTSKLENMEQDEDKIVSFYGGSAEDVFKEVE